MSTKFRTYDSNIKRKTNKQYHQLEKNIMEKNFFTQIGIVTTKASEFINNPSLSTCTIRLVPTVLFKEFDKDSGYQTVPEPKPTVINAFIPVHMRKNIFDSLSSIYNLVPQSNTINFANATNLFVNEGDVVLITFTDVDYRSTLTAIMNGKPKTSSTSFIETDQTKHSQNFGIITMILHKG
jgi:hypothetical protein